MTYIPLRSFVKGRVAAVYGEFPLAELETGTVVKGEDERFVECCTLWPT